MRSHDLRGGAGRWRRLAIASFVCSFAASLALVFAPTATQDAVADGETRTLHLFHTHTQETIDATFRVDGHYDPTVLRQLNHFLRDWRNDDETNMDPRLFDAIWEAYRTAGATDRIQIYSAYRSPETNAMLRRRSKAVAEHSQHMLGKAMDTTMPGFPMQRIREAGMKLQHGGVGWYPSANFVHLDVGGVRSWPRMSYDQLAGLFPDGKTVHIASNGQTLPGYEQARAELAQRGQTELPPAQQDSPGLLAWLFGGNAGTAREDEEDRRTAVASAAPPQAEAAAPAPQVAFQTPAAQAQPVALAYAPAAAQPQPFDGQTPIAGQAGLTGQSVPGTPGAEAVPDAAAPRQQVTTLEPGAAPDTEDAVMPLPPRRPADLVAAVDVPLPPVRPEALATVEDSRRSVGPATKALAFAALEAPEAGDVARAPHLRPIPSVIAETNALRMAVKPLALRAARDRMRFAASVPTDSAADTANASPEASAPGGLTGLRRAAQRLADKAAL